MRTAGWFNDGEYSDLTIRLSDDREIKVHKVVLCKQNEYFASLCGSSSSFAEAKQSVIKLEEDDPDALEAVLRHIYGADFLDSDPKPWRFWLDLAITADKYLVPQLSETALDVLRNTAFRIEDADTILDIIESIKSDMAHDEVALKLTEDLRKKKLWLLQRSARYRDSLFEDRDSMNAHFDAFDEVVGQGGLEEQTIFMCDQHATQILRTARYSYMGCCLCGHTNCVKSHRVFLSGNERVH